MLLSRLWEQAVLGLGAMLLARQLGIDQFAPVSVLLIVNSLSVTLADFGLGADVIRQGSGQSGSLEDLRAVRLRNGAGALAGVLAGWIIGGDGGLVLALSAGVWAAAAESSIRRASALRLRSERSVMIAELAGSTTLVGFIVAGSVSTSRGVALVGCGLILKSVLEAALLPGWRAAFAHVEGNRDRRPLWVAQAVAYTIANLDFLILGLLQPKAVFAVYTLAFRLASAVPSQLAYVVGRISSVDLAEAVGSERQAPYVAYTRMLFTAGVVGALATAAIAPALPWALGDDWDSIPWLVVALSCAIPWRMAIGVAGTLAMVEHRSSELLRIELVHLVVVGLAYSAGAAIGLAAFVGIVVVSTVAATVVYHLRCTQLSSLTAWRPLVPLGIATLVAIAVIAPQVVVPT